MGAGRGRLGSRVHATWQCWQPAQHRPAINRAPRANRGGAGRVPSGGGARPEPRPLTHPRGAGRGSEAAGRRARRARPSPSGLRPDRWAGLNGLNVGSAPPRSSRVGNFPVRAGRIGVRAGPFAVPHAVPSIRDVRLPPSAASTPPRPWEGRQRCFMGPPSDR